MPDMTFDTAEAMPEDWRPHAKQVDGKFVIAVAPKAKVDEFRTNNTNLSKERDTLKGFREAVVTAAGHDDMEKFTGELTELRSIAQRVKDGELKGADNIEKEVTKRIEGERKALGDRITAAQSGEKVAKEDAAKWKGEYKKLRLHNEVAAVVLDAKSGAEPTAMQDLMMRAERVFVVEDNGAVVSRDADGSIVYSKKDGSTPLGIAEWLQDELQKAPHLAKASIGSGGPGNRTGAARHGMSQEAWNALSPAERITRERQANAR